ncbi:MAG: zinc-ribbon domain-containing protein [Candidatus Methanoplasma sp.]|jgi:ribosomal protein L40E|nr:zinc-ribbon domain-containing protein [Candidatus Methanoplasma sp.]
MNNAASARTFNLKWFGTLTFKQMLGLISAFALALALTLFGFGTSCFCFGMLIIAVVLYMLPRILGADNIKLMTLVGILFGVSAVLIGGLAMAPGFVDSNDNNPPENDYFKNVEYTYSGTDITIRATLKENSLEGDISSYSILFKYGEVKGIGFRNVNVVFNKEATMTISGSTLNGSIQLDPDNLYIGYLTIENADGDTVKSSDTHGSFLTGAYVGEITQLSLYGCLVATAYILIIFFMIMIFSTIMRGRMEKTRERMEKEGRLYPQGYGRCETCGSMVLPGEVRCRKCGTYIDRPDEMKPKKKDFFECSDCGAEVPMDAKQCPKCGAEFEEEEFEVTHADGTVEVTAESFGCPECGYMVPGTASFCPKCGANFDNKKK